MWNYDEKPVIIGRSNKQKVFTLATNKYVPQKQDGNRSSVTALKFGNAIGEHLPPVIISEGAYKTRGRFHYICDEESGLLPGARFTCSPSGYTDRVICYEFISKHFHPLTKLSTNNYGEAEDRLLIIDQHDSHICADVLDFCIEIKIHIMVFPPHSTHRLQPMDVGIFGPLQKAYGVEVARWTAQAMGAAMNVADFFP